MTTLATQSQKNAVCNTCTLKLVALAYRRAPWFRLLREPLKLGMRFLASIYRVDPRDYQVRTPACYACIRFYKVALKEKGQVEDEFKAITPRGDTVSLWATLSGGSSSAHYLGLQ